MKSDPASGHLWLPTLHCTALSWPDWTGLQGNFQTATWKISRSREQGGDRSEPDRQNSNRNRTELDWSNLWLEELMWIHPCPARSVSLMSGSHQWTIIPHRTKSLGHRDALLPPRLPDICQRQLNTEQALVLTPSGPEVRVGQGPDFAFNNV